MALQAAITVTLRPLMA